MKKVADILEELKISSEEFAKRSRLPLDRAGRILAGEEPSLADLRAISRGLRIPLTRFIEDQDGSNLEMLFRITAGNRQDLGVEAAHSFVRNALKILPPKESRIEWSSELDVREETIDEASRLALSFRAKYCDGRVEEPLLDLPAVLDRLGVVVARLETSRFEGASVVADGYGFIFVSPRIPSRMLFTVAHELGHLIAHHREHHNAVFDLASDIGSYRSSNRSERFVDAFASDLLLPDAGVAIALQEIREGLRVDSESLGDVEIAYLARLFGVSFIAAAIKCERLGLLPQGGAFSLNDHLRKNFGSAEKRADAVEVPQRPAVEIPGMPSVLLRAAVEGVERGDVSLGWVTDSFGCTVNDIYAGRASLRAAHGYRH